MPEIHVDIITRLQERSEAGRRERSPVDSSGSAKTYG
jgi:hypothetical protein